MLRVYEFYVFEFCKVILQMHASHYSQPTEKKKNTLPENLKLHDIDISQLEWFEMVENLIIIRAVLKSVSKVCPNLYVCFIEFGLS